MNNVDQKTVESFGAEWSHFAQDELDCHEIEKLFDLYFHIFPWQSLPNHAEGFDMGCGSGRWARLVAPRVGKLNCVDPSAKALEVARRNLADLENVSLINAGTSDCLITPRSQDFGYSLGVLHHIPNTAEAMKDCVKLLKPGAPFLVYLYYKFDNKPMWYAWIWKISNAVRLIVSRMAERPKVIITDIIAALAYLPLARIALSGERFGLDVNNWLLSSYRDCSFYTMRTDSRDRFGTPLEQRFTRREIETMMVASGLENIVFSERFPFWCGVGKKKQ